MQQIAELRGKTMAVTRPNSISDQAARAGLPRVGLQPDTDVRFLSTGGYPESIAALETGIVDAASLNVPFVFDLSKRGYPELLNVTALRIPFAVGVLGMTRRTIDARPELPERALRALAQAVHRLQTDREFGIATLGRYSQLDDRELLGATIDYAAPLYQADLYPDLQGVQAVLDAEENPGARTARPEEFVEYRFVDQLRASGFLDQLDR
jgi:ABC-type nitrate/sulfonate/bicarbonate transport system substrate-binding protein